PALPVPILTRSEIGPPPPGRGEERMHAPGGPACDDGHRHEEPDRPGRQHHVRTAGPYAPGPHRPAVFVRLSSNGRLSHPSLFEREGGIGSPWRSPGPTCPSRTKGASSAGWSG